jgi:hypothetical protein
MAVVGDRRLSPKLISFAVFTDCQVGDILGAAWSHIDWESGQKAQSIWARHILGTRPPLSQNPPPRCGEDIGGKPFEQRAGM